MIIRKLDEVKDYKLPVIKAKLISTEGSVPRNSGTFMIIADNCIFGSIGGGQLEYYVINKSKEKLLSIKTTKKEIINIPLGPSIGQCCGVYARVEITKYSNGKKSIINENFLKKSIDNLYIFGAGHIGQALVSKSFDLNFNIHLIDSRKEYLDITKNKNITKIFAKFPWMFIKNLPEKSFYIILTHSHDYDFKIINEILNLNTFKFIGLIGSKTKAKKFNNRLIKLGHNQDNINKIECPIGLKNIQSKKPSEVAISIIGRLLEFRYNSLKNILNNNKILKKINER